MTDGDPLRVDAIDEQIVAALVDDGRASFRSIGDAVGLSAPAVKRRIDRLRTAGVIRSFTAVLDPRALGWRAEAFVELFCGPRTAAASIGALLTDHPEVVAAYSVTGDADALVHLRVADTAHLEQVLERIRADPMVGQTRSVVVLSRLIDRPAAPRR